MTIRTRLTLLFTALVSTLLGVFCVVIYGAGDVYRREEFYERLRAEALASAELLFGKETISPDLFKLLDKNHMTVLNEEEIIIYNYLNRKVYESGTDYLIVTKDILDRVRLEKEVRLREKTREIVGVLFTDRYNHLVVFASAVDKYGFLKQRNLGLVLAAGWLLATGVVFAAGRFFAGKSLEPIARIVGRIDAITASRLDLRLDEGNGRDEIAQLSGRFNRMLDRLEESFRAQRSFVSYASHELRTPLTAITGQIEVALLSDDDADELRAMLRSILDDARQLNRLTNGLLSLADVSRDESSVTFAPLHFDDLLWQVRSELLRAQANCTVRVQLEETDATDADFAIPGNEPLLRVVAFNLLENACKFSPDHSVGVRLSAQAGGIELRVHNFGPPIPPDELPNIFIPFQRGSNAHRVPGHGIGLPLIERIVRLHRGKLAVDSAQERGTTFTLTLPRQF
jgi:signal transduction histidine kinase